jgi:hypothetical protein
MKVNFNLCGTLTERDSQGRWQEFHGTDDNSCKHRPQFELVACQPPPFFMREADINNEESRGQLIIRFRKPSPTWRNYPVLAMALCHWQPGLLGRMIWRGVERSRHFGYLAT